MSQFSVIGTLPPRRTRVGVGDHASYNGIYVGLVVDLEPPFDDATVAYKDRDGKVAESNFSLSSLRIAEPR